MVQMVCVLHSNLVSCSRKLERRRGCFQGGFETWRSCRLLVVMMGSLTSEVVDVISAKFISRELISSDTGAIEKNHGNFLIAKWEVGSVGWMSARCIIGQPRWRPHYSSYPRYCCRYREQAEILPRMHRRLRLAHLHFRPASGSKWRNIARRLDGKGMRVLGLRGFPKL